MRAVVDVGLMFYGRSNSDVFFNLPIAKEPIAVLLFRLILLIAFYTAASALLIRFGNDLLRWIRIATSKISNIDLIFGVNSNSIVFGRNIADVKGNMIVYVDSTITDNHEASIRDLGGITYSTKNALKAAENGDPDAQCQIGTMYFHGEGVDKDYTKAKEWYINAAYNGDDDAQKRLNELKDLVAE